MRGLQRFQVMGLLCQFFVGVPSGPYIYQVNLNAISRCYWVVCLHGTLTNSSKAFWLMLIVMVGWLVVFWCVECLSSVGYCLQVVIVLLVGLSHGDFSSSLVMAWTQYSYPYPLNYCREYGRGFGDTPCHNVLPYNGQDIGSWDEQMQYVNNWMTSD